MNSGHMWGKQKDGQEWVQLQARTNNRCKSCKCVSVELLLHPKAQKKTHKQKKTSSGSRDYCLYLLSSV